MRVCPHKPDEFSLERWLSDFLWYWQDSGGLTDEAAYTLVEVLPLDRSQIGKHPLPDPQDLLQRLEGNDAVPPGEGAL